MKAKKKKCKVIAISSIKGGVGKTTTTVNLGCVIARVYGKRTLVLDANLSAPNLGIHFGLIDINASIHDVLNGKVKHKDAIYEYHDKLHVMPGLAKGKFRKEWMLGSLIKKLRKSYDVILIDTSPSLDELDKVVECVDEIIFVATPDYPTLSTTLQLVEHIEKRVPVAGVILNMVKGEKFELSAKDMEAASSLKVIGGVPYNIALSKAVADLLPLAFHSPKNKISKVYGKIAEWVLNEELSYRESSFGWFGFFRR